MKSNNLMVFALLICSIGISQTMPKSKYSSKAIRYGIKVGLNLSTLTDFDSDNTSSTRNSINAGVYMQYKFADKFTFQPELLYSTQGMVENQMTNNGNVRIKYKLDYIALPLMVKFYPVKNYNFEIGPQIAFNIKKDIEGKSNGQTVSYDLDDFFEMNGIDAKTSKVDFALNFGACYELPIGLNFCARYSYGLTKVFTGADVVDANGKPESVKNSVFTIGMGYTFK